ncbi:sensor domain-containing diguanylate cyclase [Halospina sp. K52047b]|uniref:sensor domain-containing diguanylate cyclase n=1 Tax=Halospina sp. K52047b TaxID=2614160 RepID=UPI00124A90CE|nr:sensor domain-containing diguanylate cyclase [Halospina sp. K52047b]KAA8984272.1 GGDEF domain-containing protein [Halospina sp. K52047b]
MTESRNTLHEFHWIMDMLQTIEVGLVVLDRQLRIQLWNGFMENHSGFSATRVQDCSLLEIFPEIHEGWIWRKMETALTLNMRTFTTWEQRPHPFPFRNARPITGTEPYMYQNITFSPLTSASGEVDHVCLVVYDVTDSATAKLRMERSNARLQQQSQSDGLTGLLNRCAWESLLASEFERFRRYGSIGTLLMLDIDHFKPINDTWGHQAGDDVIRAVSGMISERLRQTDIAGRYGGEEFAVILPETDIGGGEILGERLRQSISTMEVTTEAGIIQCTISLGVAQVSSTMGDHHQWLSLVDKALYAAKDNGRNQIALAETPHPVSR